MPAPIFNKKPEVEREGFRDALRKKIRGIPTPRLSFQEKTQLERKIFGSSFTKRISQEDYRKALEKMERTKFRALSDADRSKTEGMVRYLKKIGEIESLRNPSQVKEEKKDTSAFQGKPYLNRPEVRQWLKRDEAWKITKMPSKDRPKLEKKLFDPKRFGSFIDQREAKIVSKDFENFPTRVKTRYGIQGRGERVRTSKLLKKFLGK